MLAATFVDVFHVTGTGAERNVPCSQSAHEYHQLSDFPPGHDDVVGGTGVGGTGVGGTGVGGTGVGIGVGGCVGTFTQ